MQNFKKQVVELIHKEKERLGSYTAVANKCGVSEAVISQIIADKYPAKDEAMHEKIAQALGHVDDDYKWNIATDTSNFLKITKLAEAARKNRMFVPISDKAGMGKSAPLRYYAMHIDTHSFYLQCREWSKREFIKNMFKSLGLSYPGGVVSYDELLDTIVDYFSKRRAKKPLLIIDEGDKLKPAALRFLIPLYNELEDKLSVIISGTENLEKEIKRGVRYAAKGYDEIDSRFGRNYIHITGSTLVDIQKICRANGITSPEQQKQIFDECNPVTREIENRSVKVVEDLRRVKRVIQRHQLINQ
jgi:DNA transposition AAA+ family ATPase